MKILEGGNSAVALDLADDREAFEVARKLAEHWRRKVTVRNVDTGEWGEVPAPAVN